MGKGKGEYMKLIAETALARSHFLPSLRVHAVLVQIDVNDETLVGTGRRRESSSVDLHPLEEAAAYHS